MRVTIDDDTAQLIDVLLRTCETCGDLGRCVAPYHNRKEVIKAAILKFSSLDCTSPNDEDD